MIDWRTFKTLDQARLSEDDIFDENISVKKNSQ